MDPLSIASACASLLVGITTLSKQLTPFVLTARGARRDVDGLSRELTSLELCVCTLKDEDFAFPDSLKAQLVGVLANCDNVIQDMQRIIQRHQTTGVGRNLQSSFTDRDAVSRLRERLEAHKSVLEITLDLANLNTVKAVKDDTSAIKAELTALKTQVMQLRRMKAGPNPMLQRFLDESIAYTESLVDPSDHPSDGGVYDAVTGALNSLTCPLVLPAGDTAAAIILRVEAVEALDFNNVPEAAFAVNNKAAIEEIDDGATSVTSHEPALQPSRNAALSASIPVEIKRQLPAITSLSDQMESSASKTVAGSHSSNNRGDEDQLKASWFTNPEPQLLQTIVHALDPDVDTMKELVDEAMLTTIEAVRCKSPMQIAPGSERAQKQTPTPNPSKSHATHQRDALLLYILNCLKSNATISISAIEHLLSQGADINAPLTPTLIGAHQHPHPTSPSTQIPHLLPLPLKPGWTTLHIFTAFTDHTHTLIPHLAHLNANLDAQDASGLIPLQWSLAYDIRPAAGALIAAGASTASITLSHIFLYSNYHIYRSIAIPGHRLATSLAADLGTVLRRPSACWRRKHWRRCPRWRCEGWCRRVSVANMQVFARNCLDLMLLFRKEGEYGVQGREEVEGEVGLEMFGFGDKANMRRRRRREFVGGKRNEGCLE